MPYVLKERKDKRKQKNKEFIHKLKYKYNKIKIETVDERSQRTSSGMNLSKT